MRWRGLIIGSLVAFAGCSTADRTPTPQTSGSPEPTQAPANFRVSRTLDSQIRERVAFKRDGEDWRGSYLAYESKVNGFGEVAFRARPHAPATGKAAKRQPWARPAQLEGVEARFNTVAIRRGEVDLAAGAFEVKEHQGEVVVQRGAVREVLANTDRGLEQQWEFDGEPSGSDDLVVEVAHAGAGYVESDERGLVFADTAGVGFIYGHATWVDSNNVRTAVPTRWTGERIEMRVPRAVLESSAYPASLDPLLIPPNSTSSTYVPDTASAGTTNAVVWESYGSGYPNLRFSLVGDADGQISATTYSKPVSIGSFQSEPTITSTGSGFVVAWRDTRSGTSNIRLASISTTGVITNEIAVAAGATAQFTPAVSCVSATNCLVAWHETQGGFAEIRSSIVNPSTGSASAVTILSPALGANQYGAAIANNGSAYFVAWETVVGAQSDVYGRNVTSGGVGGNPAFAITAGVNDEYTPSVGYNGTNWIVGYTEWNGTDEDAHAQRTTTAGGPTGAVIDIATGAGDQGYATFAQNGSTVLTSYYAGSDILARTITGGATLGSPFTISNAAGEQDTPNVSFGSGNFYYVVYNDEQTGTWTAKGTRASTSAAISPTANLFEGPPRCDVVSTSYNPTSPQAVGTAITITGSATCVGAGATPQYEFSINSGSGLQVVQAYSATATYNWNTTALSGATYQVLVRSRRAGSVAAYEGQQSTSYALTGGPGLCNTLSATASPAGTAAVGSPVVITGNATCTETATPEYQFWLNDGSGFVVVQNYSSDNTFDWNTTGYAGTTYSVLVRSRRAGSSASFDTQQTFNYTLTGGTGSCNVLTASASPTSPQAAGTAVTVTGNATCSGGATPNYQFYTLAPGGFWTLAQNFGASATFNWNTTGLVAGTHTILVRSRASTSSATQAQTTISYDIFGGGGGGASCTSVSFTASPPSGSPVGTSVTLTASSVCTAPPNPEYQFYYRLTPSGFWTLLRNYATSNVATWNTVGPAGTYQLLARVRYVGTTATAQTVANYDLN